MKFVPKFIGEVVEGKLKLDEPSSFKSYLASLTGLVEVVVRKPRKNRTTPQNDYYWGVVLPTIALSQGNTKEELHEIFRRKFLVVQVLEYRGIEIRIPGSTAILNTKEFGEYLEKIFIEAAELNITIPEAGEIE